MQSPRLPAEASAANRQEQEYLPAPGGSSPGSVETGRGWPLEAEAALFDDTRYHIISRRYGHSENTNVKANRLLAAPLVRQHKPPRYRRTGRFP